MSGGERQMVAVGRAMMSAPAILMLDEPSLGLAPLVCRELFRSLARIKETGVGIFLVEQNAKQGLAIADRGYLLDNGHIVGSDSAEACPRTRRSERPISELDNRRMTCAILRPGRRRAALDMEPIPGPILRHSEEVP